MRLLPLIVSYVVAVLVVPVAIRGLAKRGFLRPNFQGKRIPTAAGMAALLAAMLALVPLALVDGVAGEDLFGPDVFRPLFYALGVAVLGFWDDLLDGAADGPRGLRGHAAAFLEGRVTPGFLKAMGTVGLALGVLMGQGLSATGYLAAVGVLVLTTHLFNMLDLRPGRAAKVFIGLGVFLPLVTGNTKPLEATGLLAGPMLALFPYDLRERTMVGDTGAAIMGALAGFWLVGSLSSTGRWVALAVLLVITVYAELRSLGSLIERTPGLRQLDSLGRPSNA